MIGIVGGGLAGLGAAYRLQRAGHEVRVFEAGEESGGRARLRRDRISTWFSPQPRPEG